MRDHISEPRDGTGSTERVINPRRSPQQRQTHRLHSNRAALIREIFPRPESPERDAERDRSATISSERRGEEPGRGG